MGNVFDLGKKFTKDFDLTFVDREGKKQYPIMGCYGIGISRLMGIIVEKYNDENGIIMAGIGCTVQRPSYRPPGRPTATRFIRLYRTQGLKYSMTTGIVPRGKNLRKQT